MDMLDLTDLIRSRAYQIWESEGWPNGRHVVHWLRAESEIYDTTKDHAPAGKAAKQTKKSGGKSGPSKPRSKPLRANGH